jgi:signal transduction histidine kinase
MPRSLTLAGFRRSQHRFLIPAFVMLVGVSATIAASIWFGTEAEQRQRAEELLKNSGQLVVQSVSAAFDKVDAHTRAIAAMFAVEEDATEDDFRSFADAVGLVEGTITYSYVALIPAEQIEEYAAQMKARSPGYALFGVDAEGNRIPLEARAEYAPVEYFAPENLVSVPATGMDFMSEPNRREALYTARRMGSMAVTTFLRPFGQSENDWLLTAQPVWRADGSLRGFISTPVDLSELLASQIPKPWLDLVSWQIADPAYGTVTGSAPESNAPIWTGSVLLGQRLLTVTVAARAGLLETGPMAWAWDAIPMGIAATLAAAALAWLWMRQSQSHQERAALATQAAAKDRFLASVSHELRTPLTAVIGFLTEVLRGHGLTEEDKREMTGVAVEQAQEMKAIVDDLLVAIRQEEPSQIAVQHTINLAAEMSEVIEAVPESLASEIDVRGTATAWADSGRVRQILRNLVDNAVKHGSPPIEITIEEDSAATRIRVSDHGSEISPQDQARLFTAYGTIGAARSAPGSLGLGLWVSRRLARAMSGDITYRFDGTSIFELTLPRAPAAGMTGP